jgi:hypothetical protein
MTMSATKTATAAKGPTFGERLGDFASSVNISWADVGRVFDVSPSSISRWIGDKTEPYAWLRDSITKKLDVLDERNREINLYSNLRELRRSDKVAQLRGVLSNRLL